jgi:hypothetical protein
MQRGPHRQKEMSPTWNNAWPYLKWVIQWHLLHKRHISCRNSQLFNFHRSSHQQTSTSRNSKCGHQQQGANAGRKETPIEVRNPGKAVGEAEVAIRITTIPTCAPNRPTATNTKCISINFIVIHVGTMLIMMGTTARSTIRNKIIPPTSQEIMRTWSKAQA